MNGKTKIMEIYLAEVRLIAFAAHEPLFQAVQCAKIIEYHYYCNKQRRAKNGNHREIKITAFDRNKNTLVVFLKAFLQYSLEHFPLSVNCES